jgi:uncharacterized repeat protein (TIGR01451 family)
MKINKTLTALIAGASIGMSGQALSAVNGAGTTLSNTASLTYTVGGATATSDSEDTLDFAVDKKIDFTLTEVNAMAKVFPGLLSSTNDDRVYTFKLTNAGNSDQAFKISDIVANYALGVDVNGTAQGFLLGNVDIYTSTSSSFADAKIQQDEILLEADTLQADLAGTFATGDDEIYIHIEADDVPGLNTTNYYDVGSDGLDYTIDLQPAKSFTLINVRPLTAIGGSIITADDSADVWTPNVAQTVFADSLANSGFGIESIDAVFGLQSAYVALKKTASVTESGITGYTGTKFLIPGATVEYTLTATNHGELAADSVIITDNLATQLVNGNPVFLYSSISMGALPTGATLDGAHDEAAGNIIVNVGTLTAADPSVTTDEKIVTFTVDVQ